MQRKVSWSLFLTGLIALCVSIGVSSIVITHSFQLTDLDALLSNEHVIGHYNCIFALMGVLFVISFLFGIIMYRFQRTLPAKSISIATAFLMLYPYIWFTIIALLRYAFPQIPYLTLYMIHNPVSCLCGMYSAVSGSLMLDASLEILSIAAMTMGIVSFSKLKKSPFFIGVLFMVISVAVILFVMHYIYVTYSIVL